MRKRKEEVKIKAMKEEGGHRSKRGRGKKRKR